MQALTIEQIKLNQDNKYACVDTFVYIETTLAFNFARRVLVDS